MTETIIGRMAPSVAVVRRKGQALNTCASCGQSLGPAGQAWKDGAVRREVPIAQAGGPSFDTGFPGVMLRHFYCPACAVLLDTETAMTGDPALDDRLTLPCPG